MGKAKLASEAWPMGVEIEAGGGQDVTRKDISPAKAFSRGFGDQKKKWR